MKSKNEIENALWSGGWDSTFMIIQELRKKKTIQPVYIIDDERKSNKKERETINAIIDELAKVDNYGGTLLPVKYVKKSEIPRDKEIEDVWKKVNKETGIGIQHDWIARYAKWKNIDICFGHEKGVSLNSHVAKALNMYTVMKQREDGAIIIDKENSSKEGAILLGRLIMPNMQYTEEDMVKLVKKWGCENIMKHIWFCHNPINNMPCGLCHPCEIKMESKMEFLLPEIAQKRYKKKKKIEKVFGKKISEKYAGLMFRLHGKK